MRKNIIYTEVWCNGWYMDFMFRDSNKSEYLFTMKFNPRIFQFFSNGKSLEQLRRQTQWKNDKELCRLIRKRIPYEFRNIRKGGEEE